jgi:hypothetical protein
MEIIFHGKQLKKVEIFISKSNFNLNNSNQFIINFNIGRCLTINTSEVFISLENDGFTLFDNSKSSSNTHQYHYQFLIKYHN